MNVIVKSLVAIDIEMDRDHVEARSPQRSLVDIIADALCDAGYDATVTVRRADPSHCAVCLYTLLESTRGYECSCTAEVA